VARETITEEVTRFLQTVYDKYQTACCTDSCSGDVLQQGRHLAGALGLDREIKPVQATDAVERSLAHPHLHRPVVIGA